jgi:CheY-like chemotaxis protein
MVVSGRAQLAMMEEVVDPALKEDLEIIIKECERAKNIIHRLLNFSKPSKGIEEEADINQAIEEVVQLVEHQFNLENVILKKNYASDLPPARLDKKSLQEVIINLLNNAEEAIEDEGTIEITTKLENDLLRIDVKDTGAGIPEDVINKIFDPFFSTKQLGRGLGLAAVLGIVRGHRGGIEVQSNPGEGTAFRVLLPVGPALDAAETAPAAEAETPAVAEDLRAQGGTILLVDDEEEVRSVAKSMLEQCGLAVLTATDGVEAVEKFRQHHAELSAVLLDVTMPRMGGDEACQEMTKIDPQVPIILSSGYSEEDSAQRFPTCSPACFLQKPYRMRHLLKKLGEVLSARERPPGGCKEK